MVILNDEDISLIKEISQLKNINKYEYNPIEVISGLKKELEDDDYLLDLMDFIDDKKMEYGFNSDYSTNELGDRLTKLWDKIYYQSEE